MVLSKSHERKEMEEGRSGGGDGGKIERELPEVHARAVTGEKNN